MNDKNHLNKLKKDFDSLNISVNSLKTSFKESKNIGIKKAYNFEEQESFDSFTSKFFILRRF